MNYPTYPTYPYYQNYPAYQQQYPQPQMTSQPVSQPVSQPFTTQTVSQPILQWIKDEQEALDFPLTAGQSVFLMTQNEDYLFGKSCDQLGKTTIIKKRLVDETNGQESKVDLKEYIRREEIEDLITDKIQREIERKMSEISFKPTKPRKQVIIDED